MVLVIATFFFLVLISKTCTLHLVVHLISLHESVGLLQLLGLVIIACLLRHSLFIGVLDSSVALELLLRNLNWFVNLSSDDLLLVLHLRLLLLLHVL